MLIFYGLFPFICDSCNLKLVCLFVKSLYKPLDYYINITLGSFYFPVSLIRCGQPCTFRIYIELCSSFCIGTVFTTGAGEYWLTLFDEFGATGLTLIAFIEIICVMYVYGHRRFTDDIEDMTGKRIKFYFLFIILEISLNI